MAYYVSQSIYGHNRVYGAPHSNILTNIELLKLVKYRKPLAMNTIPTPSPFSGGFPLIPPKQAIADGLIHD